MYSFFPGHYELSFKTIRAIGGIAMGQGEFGEIFQIIEKIDPDNPDTWTDAWEQMGDRLRTTADEASAKGHHVTAGGAYCRATGYYHNAQFFLEGTDPRRNTICNKYKDCFIKGTCFDEPAPQEVHIPYEGSFLYAYFLPAAAPAPSGKTPAIVWFGGGDSTAEEAYFAICKDFSKRGFHCLIVDGPGQGATLRLNHIRSRYDYEAAGSAAFDYLETRDDVDLSRVAVVSWSLGGYYAPRIVSFEHRYAACITYGARYDAGANWLSRFSKTPHGDHPLLPYVKWAHGAETYEEGVEKFKRFNLEGVLQGVTCDMLIVFGGADPQQKVEDAYRIQREAVNARSFTLKIFSPEEGACCHVCGDNLALANAYTGDWLLDLFEMAEKKGT